jgi:hypothetical protein
VTMRSATRALGLLLVLAAPATGQEARRALPGDVFAAGVPVGLAFLDDGSFVVGDFGRNRLYRVALAGREARLLSDEGLHRPENIAVKPPQSAAGARSEPNSLTLRVGLSLQSHVDLLATPFRQHGSGVAVGVEYRRGRLRLELDADVGGTSSALEGQDFGVEDVWNGVVQATYAGAVHEGDRVTLRAGASLAALGFVRRHHYGPTAARELFGDLIVPLSVVGEVAARVDPSTRIENRAEIGIVSLFFRSSFAGTKGWPEAVVAAPWDLVLVRNRLSLEHALSPRTRLTLEHGLTVYAADRHRRVRLLRQDVSAGIRLMLGRVDP